jgi:peptidyl-prolyl cis-trans isomerase C
VKTSYGWHIIKLDDRRTKEPPSFDSVKDKIIKSLVVQMTQDAATALRGKAQLEYLDADIKKQAEDQQKKQAESETGGPEAASPKP